MTTEPDHAAKAHDANHVKPSALLNAANLVDVYRWHDENIQPDDELSDAATLYSKIIFVLDNPEIYPHTEAQRMVLLRHKAAIEEHLEIHEQDDARFIAEFNELLSW